MRADVCVMYPAGRCVAVLLPIILVDLSQGEFVISCGEACPESQRWSTMRTGAWFTLTTRYTVTPPVMSFGRRVKGGNARAVGRSVGYDSARGGGGRGRARGHLQLRGRLRGHALQQRAGRQSLSPAARHAGRGGRRARRQMAGEVH